MFALSSLSALPTAIASLMSTLAEALSPFSARSVIYPVPF